MSVNDEFLSLEKMSIAELVDALDVLSIDDGTNDDDNDGVIDIEIPDDLLIQSSGNHLASIAEKTCLNLLANIMDSEYLQQRAILAPTNEIVEKVNDYMLSLVPEEERVCLSLDSPCTANESVESHHDIHTIEFLNPITSLGLPNHELKLKRGSNVGQKVFIPRLSLRPSDSPFHF
ncbi:PREDICTED: uncharacterized protein LOC105973332 [Erythranthe guttata]|uniref:uncharacterized protein LOC105973332 n=1 Tax=Erythranthe guttata TaxID=4155 RepID=UPI00064DAC57|nr:PREDICTED: uncharacterized protein LOC105973332 [Erythranthe guttata]|eukprot:XP_012853807.1 PREDICTED: uncharacterized protein LOC105973332 [Erythranthe guttata]